MGVDIKATQLPDAPRDFAPTTLEQRRGLPWWVAFGLVALVAIALSATGAGGYRTWATTSLLGILFGIWWSWPRTLRDATNFSIWPMLGGALGAGFGAFVAAEIGVIIHVTMPILMDPPSEEDPKRIPAIILATAGMLVLVGGAATLFSAVSGAVVGCIVALVRLAVNAQLPNQPDASNRAAYPDRCPNVFDQAVWALRSDFGRETKVWLATNIAIAVTMLFQLGQSSQSALIAAGGLGILLIAVILLLLSMTMQGRTIPDGELWLMHGRSVAVRAALAMSTMLLFVGFVLVLCIRENPHIPAGIVLGFHSFLILAFLVACSARTLHMAPHGIRWDTVNYVPADRVATFRWDGQTADGLWKLVLATRPPCPSDETVDRHLLVAPLFAPFVYQWLRERIVEQTRPPRPPVEEPKPAPTVAEVVAAPSKPPREGRNPEVVVYYIDAGQMTTHRTFTRKNQLQWQEQRPQWHEEDPQRFAVRFDFQQPLAAVEPTYLIIARDGLSPPELGLCDWASGNQFPLAIAGDTAREASMWLKGETQPVARHLAALGATIRAGGGRVSSITLTELRDAGAAIVVVEVGDHRHELLLPAGDAAVLGLIEQVVLRASPTAWSLLAAQSTPPRTPLGPAATATEYCVATCESNEVNVARHTAADFHERLETEPELLQTRIDTSSPGPHVFAIRRLLLRGDEPIHDVAFCKLQGTSHFKIDLGRAEMQRLWGVICGDAQRAPTCERAWAKLLRDAGIELRRLEFASGNQRRLIARLHMEIRGSQHLVETQAAYGLALAWQCAAPIVVSEHMFETLRGGSPSTTTTAHGEWQRARDLVESRQWDEAIFAASCALTLNPEFAPAYRTRGRAYLRGKGDWQRAIEDFNSAIACDPTNAESFYWRAIAFDNQGDAARALADLNETIRLHPRKSKCFFYRAALRAAANADWAGAIVDYNRALQLDPHSAEAYRGRAIVYRALGNIEAAAGDFSRAEELAAAK